MKDFLNNLLFLIALSFSFNITSAISDSQKQLLEGLPPDQRNSIELKMQQANNMQQEIEELFEEEALLIERPDLSSNKNLADYCEDCIFGYNFFKFSPSTFSPANKVPISSTYTLGPGDKIKISYYGNNEVNNESYVSRDGTLDLPILGPIGIAGLTFQDAKEAIEGLVSSQLINTEISLSLSELRSISVYVLGEAYNPGRYTVSALSSVTNTLFLSGGVNKFGSLRNIEIKRNGKVIKAYDFYNLLLKGDTSTDFKLEDGDTIFIPFFESTINIDGAFKRVGRFEFKDGETMEDAIFFGGGYKQNVSDTPRIEINSINRDSYERSISYINSDQLEAKFLADGDSISVSAISGIKIESIKLTGEVKYPGSYSITGKDTILDIINRAGGYTESAYTNGAIFTRKQVAKQQKEAFLRTADDLERLLVDRVTSISAADSGSEVTEFTLAPVNSLIRSLREVEPLGRQVVNVNFLDIKTDPFANFLVTGGDTLHIPRRPDSINVVGAVLHAVTLRYNPAKGVNEYLKLAGGLTDKADDSKIFIISPNGQAEPHQKRFFSNTSDLLPGSTIVVSENPDSLSRYQYAKFIAPIITDLVGSIVLISAVND